MLVHGFSLWRLLWLQSTGSEHSGFSSCSTQAQQLWYMGWVALWHAGSSLPRDWTSLSCVGRRGLYHWATRKPYSTFFFFLNYRTLIQCFDSLLFYFFICPLSMQNPSSPNRNQNHTPSITSMESQPLDGQGSPTVLLLCFDHIYMIGF